MSKIVKSFRLYDSTIIRIREMRQVRPFRWPERLESEADVITRLVNDAYAERNTKVVPKK